MNKPSHERVTGTGEQDLITILFRFTCTRERRLEQSCVRPSTVRDLK